MTGRLTPDFDDQDDCDLAPECPVCYAQMEWEQCDACCGDGEIDAYDEDPINESPGSFEPCRDCHGLGGFMQCSALPHTEEQMRAWRERRGAR